MKHKILYYLIHDRHPFLVIMKQTGEGWYCGDTILRSFNVTFSRSKPRLHDETYTLTEEYTAARQFLDYQLNEWKNELMNDFHLNRDGCEFLKDLKEYNREFSLRYYLSPDTKLVYLRTILYKNCSWKQELGILGENIARRQWRDNYLGSEEPMMFPSKKLIPINYEDARQLGERFIDSLIEERINEIEEFCEVKG